MKYYIFSGVSKSLQAISLFFISDWLFCSDSPTQCVNLYKIIGTCGVCIGILLYGYHEQATQCAISSCGNAKERPDPVEYDQSISCNTHVIVD
jgi:hypothetical protein